MGQSKKHKGCDIPLGLMGVAHRRELDGASASSGLAIECKHVTSSSNSLEAIEKAAQSELNCTIKLSKRRWLVLLTMSLFGICATISIGTAPILGLILELLDLREDEYLYLRQISYMSVVTSIPTAWYVDKFGIKRSILTAATLYAVSSFLKAALYSPTLPGWPVYRMFCWFVGGLIGAQAGSVFFVLPLKVAETWFSAKERSMAWTMMVSTGELGTCVVSLLYPRIIQTLPDIQILAYINIVAPIVTCVVCLTCISTDGPKHPPSERQARANKLKVVPFKTSIKRIVANKDVLLHLLHTSICKACATSIGTVFQKILTNAGHSTIFAGNLMSINAFVSIIMLILMSSFVHKTENPILICKLSSAVLSFLQVVYMIFLAYQMPGWSLVAMSTVLIVCRSWAVPNITNITAHLAAGLVSQATIVGFSVTLGVLVSTLINSTFASLIQFQGEGQKRHSNYTQPLIFITIVTGINESVYQLFFWGQSRKEAANEPAKDENQQDIESVSHKD